MPLSSVNASVFMCLRNSTHLLPPDDTDPVSELWHCRDGQSASLLSRSDLQATLNFIPPISPLCMSSLSTSSARVNPHQASLSSKSPWLIQLHRGPPLTPGSHGSQSASSWWRRMGSSVCPHMPRVALRICECCECQPRRASSIRVCSPGVPVASPSVGSWRVSSGTLGAPCGDPSPNEHSRRTAQSGRESEGRGWKESVGWVFSTVNLKVLEYK